LENKHVGFGVGMGLDLAFKLLLRQSNMSDAVLNGGQLVAMQAVPGVVVEPDDAGPYRPGSVSDGKLIGSIDSFLCRLPGCGQCGGCAPV
jgi:hypothetical protein